jgi:glycosyltransferase involved in cell wall biosynthesis
MVCGKPVIGTNVGGIPEITDDGRTGILGPPADPCGLATTVVFVVKRWNENEGSGTECKKTREICFFLANNWQTS